MMTTMEPMPAEPRPRSAVPAVDLALEVIEHLATRDGGTPTEIARERQVSRVGVTRVLQALSLRGYAQRDEDTGRHRLTSRLFQLTARVAPMDLRSVALPHLRRLRDRVGETAEFAVRDGEAMLLVAAVDSENPVRLFTRPGHRESMYRQATGKCILASLPESEVRNLFHAGKLTARPEYQPYDEPALLALLETIRAQGYATDGKRTALEVERIAAPVTGPAGTILGAVGVAGPQGRLVVDATTIAAVREAATAIAADPGLPG